MPDVDPAGWSPDARARRDPPGRAPGGRGARPWPVRQRATPSRKRLV